MSGGEDSQIYLIGSYHGFRDRIIESLPGMSFADPRLHRQASTAELVVDDLREARECPVSLAVFPAGKSRGVMSYVEIGVSNAHENHLVVVDENLREDSDAVLKSIADQHFTSLDSALEYLRDEPLPFGARTQVASKYPPGSTGPIPLDKVLVCGTQTDALCRVVDRAREARRDREFYLTILPENELSRISNYDLLVVNFPRDRDWDRHACLLMGAAYAHDISILMIDDHNWKYPPLQAVARRHGTLDGLFEYLTEVNDLHIASEARVMYELFQRQLAD